MMVPLVFPSNSPTFWGSSEVLLMNLSKERSTSYLVPLANILDISENWIGVKKGE